MDTNILIEIEEHGGEAVERYCDYMFDPWDAAEPMSCGNRRRLMAIPGWRTYGVRAAAAMRRWLDAVGASTLAYDAFVRDMDEGRHRAAICSLMFTEYQALGCLRVRRGRDEPRRVAAQAALCWAVGRIVDILMYEDDDTQYGCHFAVHDALFLLADGAITDGGYGALDELAVSFFSRIRAPVHHSFVTELWLQRFLRGENYFETRAPAVALLWCVRERRLQSLWDRVLQENKGWKSVIEPLELHLPWAGQASC